jgi:hypothetical protein
MGTTRRQVIQGAAAGALLMLVPRPILALAAQRAFSDESFVGGAILFGEHLAVCETSPSGETIRYLDLGSGARSIPSTSIPWPLRVNAIASSASGLTLGGHYLKETNSREVEDGDYFALRPPDLRDEPGVEDFPRGGTSLIRDMSYVPWVADFSPDTGLGARFDVSTSAGVVKGIQRVDSNLLAWIVDCPDAPNFEGAGVHGIEVVTGTRLAGATIQAGHVNNVLFLDATDGRAFIVISDLGGTELWEFDGKALRSVNVPSAFSNVAAATLAVEGGEWEVVTRRLSDGKTTQWLRSSGAWTPRQSVNSGTVTIGPEVAVAVEVTDGV